ncbi:MAG: hypothetical protein Q4F79_13200 [Eubacteriales bacterium]|nr:hypothetical protein [Eubacteriales bacterium]
MITITIPGNPRTKKNSQQILTNKKTGRSFIAPSKAFKQYQKEADAAIPQDVRKAIDYRVTVKCLYFMHTLRAVDLSNLLEATDDILTHCGILADDNCRVIASHDGSRVLYDKLNPRAEVYITPFDEEGTL